jgi:hypothetical protein
MVDAPMTLPAPVPDNLPWERQPREPVRAFHYFATYRDLGPMRSLAKAARAHKVSTDNLAQISRRWGWVERATLYDDHVDRRLRDERETELLRAERQEAALGRQMTAIAAARIYGRPEATAADGTRIAPIDSIDPSELDAVTAATLAEKGIRIRRLAMGQPTDILKGMHAISAADLVRAVEAIYEIALRFIDDDRQPRFASEVQMFVETGRLPWQDR